MHLQSHPQILDPASSETVDFGGVRVDVASVAPRLHELEIVEGHGDVGFDLLSHPAEHLVVHVPVD